MNYSLTQKEINKINEFEKGVYYQSLRKDYRIEKWVMFHSTGIGLAVRARYDFIGKKSFLGIKVRSSFSHELDVTDYGVW